VKSNSENALTANALPSPVDVAVLDDDIDFRRYMEDLLKDEGLYGVRTLRICSWVANSALQTSCCST
jgi:hypothetical protein